MALLEIIGENFRPDLTAWFGDVEAVTVYRSETSLVCTIPDASIFRSASNSIYAPSPHHHNPHQTASSVASSSSTTSSSSKIAMSTAAAMHQPLQVPINLVRNDGIIYNTGFNFTYTPEPSISGSLNTTTAAITTAPQSSNQNISTSSVSSSSSPSNQISAASNLNSSSTLMY